MKWQEGGNNFIMRISIICIFTNIRMVKFRKMRWTGHVRMLEIKNAYRIFVGKQREKRLLGRPRLRWKDIKLIYRKQRGIV